MQGGILNKSTVCRSSTMRKGSMGDWSEGLSEKGTEDVGSLSGLEDLSVRFRKHPKDMQAERIPRNKLTIFLIFVDEDSNLNNSQL